MYRRSYIIWPPAIALVKEFLSPPAKQLVTGNKGPPIFCATAYINMIMCEVHQHELMRRTQLCQVVVSHFPATLASVFGIGGP